MISLLEFLQSVNKDKFISLIRKKYSNYIDDIVDNSNNELYGWGKEVICLKCEDPYDLILRTDFIKFSRKYQWVPTFLYYFFDDDMLGLIIEPISKRKEHFDTVYHITKKEYYDKPIKQHGLRSIGTMCERWTKTDYLAFTDSSIYQHSGKLKKGYRSIIPKLFVFNDLKDFDIIADQISANKDNFIVLKIDLSKHKNFVFYKDTANPDDISAYYTFENIPTSIISIDNELTNKLP